MKKFLSIILTTILLCVALLLSSCKLEEYVCYHENLSHYKMSGENHWRVCLDCNETIGMTAHSEYGDTCSVCFFTNPIGSQGLRYVKIDGKDEYEVTGFEGQSLSKVNIASQYNGFPVTVIQSSAFANNTNLTSILIPYTIHTIDSYAFAGCSSLTEIKFVNPYDWYMLPSLTSTQYEELSSDEMSNSAKMAKMLRSTSAQYYGRKFLIRKES